MQQTLLSHDDVKAHFEHWRSIRTKQRERILDNLLPLIWISCKKEAARLIENTLIINRLFQILFVWSKLRV